MLIYLLIYYLLFICLKWYKYIYKTKTTFIYLDSANSISLVAPFLRFKMTKISLKELLNWRCVNKNHANSIMMKIATILESFENTKLNKYFLLVIKIYFKKQNIPLFIWIRLISLVWCHHFQELKNDKNIFWKNCLIENV